MTDTTPTPTPAELKKRGRKAKYEDDSQAVKAYRLKQKLALNEHGRENTQSRVVLIKRLNMYLKAMEEGDREQVYKVMAIMNEITQRYEFKLDYWQMRQFETENTVKVYDKITHRPMPSPS